METPDQVFGGFASFGERNNTRKYFFSIIHASESLEDASQAFSLYESIIAEISDKEKAVACDPEISRLLQQFISKSTEDTIFPRLLWKAFMPHLLELMINPIGSHLVQAVIKHCSRPISTENVDPEDVPSLLDLITDTLACLEGSWADAMRDSCASHTVEALIVMLMGCAPPTRPKGDYVSVTGGTCHQALGPLVGALIGDGSPMQQGAVEILSHSISGRVYQAMLGAALAADEAFRKGNSVAREDSKAHLAPPRLAETITRRMIRTCLPATLGKPPDEAAESDRATVQSLLDSPSGVRILELWARAASPVTLYKMHRVHYQGRLLELSQDNRYNYLAQSLLESLACATKVAGDHLRAYASQAVEELLPNLAQLIERRCGVIYRLAEICTALPQHQQAFTRVFAQAIEEASANQYPKGEAPKTDIRVAHALALGDHRKLVTYHGSKIVTTMMAFQPAFAARITSSMADLPAETLAALAADGVGSHVIQALFAQFNKPQRRAFPLLVGSVAQLASDKFGSHAVQAIFNVVPIANKEEICRKLAEQASLKFNAYGRHVWRTAKMDLFLHQNEMWHSTIKRSSKARELMQDIVAPAPAPLSGSKRARDSAGKKPRRRMRRDE
eukprot:gnl/Trimastix_PCT/1971.p1 GENE.gnl/Trimastix_PCT/1971~~gnl/Trimastix_PCT/1971.p1  ORF type:complete len:619 (+),score=131.83 gnl/Trimastix_PCT/1971:69-1925(+)